MVIELVVFGLLVAAFLAGLRMQQTPETAVWGNRLAALAMVVAIVYTTYLNDILADPLVWLLLGGTALAGVLSANRVKMIQMPQTVALLNGFGGAASATVAGTSVMYGTHHAAVWFVSALALFVGSFTLSGSLIAAGKLQGLVGEESVQLSGQSFIQTLFVIGLLFLVGFITATGHTYLGVVLPLTVLLAVAYGLLFSVRVGGADMPIVISLLNSLSGVAASISGLAVGNILLVSAGAVVGVTGLILTQIMCRAMNRDLFTVLKGFSPGKTETESQAEPGPHKAEKSGEEQKDPVERIADLLLEAERVIIVPGYGMAVAQAQEHVKKLIDFLVDRETSVRVAIHPVAGRMPGHMNVLLAEVDVSHERLKDLEVVNDDFPETDVAVIIGACDVVNPAAKKTDGSPISGMPILNAQEAKHVAVFNLDDEPGYSGVENPLYEEDHVVSLWGDASETLPHLLEELNR